MPAAYGSCKDYNERVLIPKEDLKCCTLTAVVEEYGQCLVMVASLEERWRALAPQLPISQLKSLNLTHYCLLELIGKSRENVSSFHIVSSHYKNAPQRLELYRLSCKKWTNGKRVTQGVNVNTCMCTDFA